MAKKKASPKKKPAKKQPPKNKAGRPTKYSAGLVIAAKFMARTAMIDKDMAAEIGVSPSTFNKWKNDHPEFAEALRKGKQDPDDAMEAALYKSGMGSTFDEIVQDRKTVPDPTEEEPFRTKDIITNTHLVRRHVAPVVTAQIFWLKNRRPPSETQKGWSDRREIKIDMEDSPLAIFAEALQNNFRLSDDDKNRITDP